MVFSSITFIFLFLPFCLAAYYLSPRGWRNHILLGFSLLFYSWGEGIYLLLILFSMGVNYVIGYWLSSASTKRKQKYVLGIGVGINLLGLIAFKYANFLSEIVGYENLFMRQVGIVHLPVGISFFTFQAISYLVDIFRGDAEAQKKPASLALYIGFFPQLIAGPIVRYKDVAFQIANRIESLDGFCYGIVRFVIGLSKKVLIANVLGSTVDIIFALPANELSTAVAWLGAFGYCFQLYFDFSGYSDMAIGLGYMFGFKFKENFNYPLTATSVTDFWRRWHISLSSWFRDYLYIPLGGGRRSPLRVYANLFTVFILCGIWHGANVTFLLWGLFHGTFLTVERILNNKYRFPVPETARMVATFIVITIGFVLFRSDSLVHAGNYYGSLFGLHSSSILPISAFINRKLVVVFVIAFLGCGPWLRNSVMWSLREYQTPIRISVGFFVMALMWLSSAYLASSAHNPFIYFRF